MQTTYKEQIEAIQQAMENRRKLLVAIPFSQDKQWLALNDAASTIAALKFHQESKAPTTSQKGLLA